MDPPQELREPDLDPIVPLIALSVDPLLDHLEQGLHLQVQPLARMPGQELVVPTSHLSPAPTMDQVLHQDPQNPLVNRMLII